MINNLLELLWTIQCDGCCSGDGANFRHGSWCGNFRFLFLAFLSLVLKFTKNASSRAGPADTTAGPDRTTPEQSDGPAGAPF